MTLKGKNSVFDKIIFLAVESNNVGEMLEIATTKRIKIKEKELFIHMDALFLQ